MKGDSFYLTVAEISEGFLEEKKSKFYSLLCPVQNKEEVEEVLTKIRKEKADANHHCYAYCLNGAVIDKKCSDAGEPQGTAGLPILKVLEGADLVNVLCVVTRYFGGTLLGTGGLTRAYQESAKDALRHAVLLKKEEGFSETVRVSYGDGEKIRRYLTDFEIPIRDIRYSEEMEITWVCRPDNEPEIIQKITDLTQNHFTIKEKEPVIFSLSNGNCRIFKE